MFRRYGRIPESVMRIIFILLSLSVVVLVVACRSSKEVSLVDNVESGRYVVDSSGASRLSEVAARVDMQSVLRLDSLVIRVDRGDGAVTVLESPRAELVTVVTAGETITDSVTSGRVTSVCDTVSVERQLDSYSECDAGKPGGIVWFLLGAVVAVLVVCLARRG